MTKENEFLCKDVCFYIKYDHSINVSGLDLLAYAISFKYDELDKIFLDYANRYDHVLSIKYYDSEVKENILDSDGNFWVIYCGWLGDNNGIVYWQCNACINVFGMVFNLLYSSYNRKIKKIDFLVDVARSSIFSAFLLTSLIGLFLIFKFILSLQ